MLAINCDNLPYSTKLHHFEQNFSARDESAAFLTND